MVCGIWVPETVFKVTNGRHVVVSDGVDKRRWRLRCSVCEERDVGVCAQCSWPCCAVPFHPMCGLNGGALRSPS